MRVAPGSRRAPAGPSSPEAVRRLREGPALERPPRPAAHQSDPTGDRTGGRQPAPSLPDADLDRALDLAREGDETGFAVLWRTLHPPLLRYLTVRGDDAPEDIAAETWLQVVRDLRGFRGGAAEFRGSFSASTLCLPLWGSKVAVKLLETAIAALVRGAVGRNTIPVQLPRKSTLSTAGVKLPAHSFLPSQPLLPFSPPHWSQM